MDLSTPPKAAPVLRNFSDGGALLASGLARIRIAMADSRHFRF
jgi:hypothetical protein